MKFLSLVLCFLVFCSCKFLDQKKSISDDRDPRESLQEIFAGFWKQGGLSEPIEEIKCFDVPTANLTMIFIGDFLKSIATNDVVSLTKTLKNFNDNFPPETSYCMGNLTETDDLKEAYGVSNIPYPVLKRKVAEYVVLHIVSLEKQAGKAYFYYFQGMFRTLGGYFGEIAQQIIDKQEREVYNQEVLLELLKFMSY